MNKTTNKMTEREILCKFETILDRVKDDPNLDGLVDFDALYDYLGRKATSLDKKAASAKAYAEKKKAAGDPLSDKIKSILSTDKEMTIDDVLAAIGDADVSAQKISSRMSKFVKAEEVVKGSTKVGTRTLTTYKLV